MTREFQYLACPDREIALDPLQQCSTCAGTGAHKFVKNPNWSPRLAAVAQPNTPITNSARVLLTHIELRRVQNGFIVMGFNLSRDYGRAIDHPAQRVCYVASSTAELLAIIENLCGEASDFVWSESVDIPITELFSRQAPET